MDTEWPYDYNNTRQAYKDTRFSNNSIIIQWANGAILLWFAINLGLPTMKTTYSRELKVRDNEWWLLSSFLPFCHFRIISKS